MFWHASVCLSTPRWGYPARSSQEGGYPSQVQVGGYPSQVQVGGYPSQVQVGVPQPGPGRGYPDGGYPNGGTSMGVSHLGYPMSYLAGGYPSGGYPNQGGPHLRYPPSDLAGGYPDRGTPPQVPPQSDLAGGYPTGGTPLSSTWYTAVGMPLAFTQEDFLVQLCLGWVVLIKFLMWNVQKRQFQYFHLYSSFFSHTQNRSII